MLDKFPSLGAAIVAPLKNYLNGIVKAIEKDKEDEIKTLNGYVLDLIEVGEELSADLDELCIMKSDGERLDAQIKLEDLVEKINKNR